MEHHKIKRKSRDSCHFSKMKGPYHWSQLATVQLLAAIWDKIIILFGKPDTGHMSKSLDVRLSVKKHCEQALTDTSVGLKCITFF